MNARALTRSTVESYGGIAIGIAIAVMPMTWWLKSGLICIFILIAIDVVCRSQLTISLSPRWKIPISFLVVTAIARVFAPTIIRDYRTRNPQPLIKVVFKDSPVFTESRQQNLTNVLDDYYRYLVETVGLNIPNELPPIGVSPKGGIGLAGGEVGAPPYYSSIIIPEDDVDTPNVVRQEYSLYAFRLLLNNGVPPADPHLNFANGEADWIFECYFVSSFVGKQSCGDGAPGNKWNDALWEIRTRYGQSYTDKLLAFTLKMWTNMPPKTPEDFDAFFRNKLLAGETVVNGDQNRFEEISAIAERHGV